LGARLTSELELEGPGPFLFLVASTSPALAKAGYNSIGSVGSGTLVLTLPVPRQVQDQVDQFFNLSRVLIMPAAVLVTALLVPQVQNQVKVPAQAPIY